MRGKLVVFRLLKRAGQARTNKFCRMFYGYFDRSNRGRYVYTRPGLIDGVPHVRIIRGVVLVKSEDARKVTGFLRKFGAEVHEWVVELRPRDERALARFKPRERHSE